MTTLISLLGKSTSDKQTGYRTAKYRFADGCREVPFFGLGLMQSIQPDRLILAGTSGSMWDVFFEHQQTDDESVLALIDAVSQEAVTSKMLRIHEERLEEKFGIPVHCLLIPYAKDQQEQIAILTSLAAAISPGETITLDVTHGFRHLPMLALVAARFLTYVRKVKVEEVYYGALEMISRNTQETPVLQLGGMLQMLDWIEALAAYEGSGNYGVFAELLTMDGMDARRADMLAQAAYYERNSNPVQAKQMLTGAHNHVRDHQGPLGSLFKDTLTEHIGWFRHGSRADWELALADRYLKRQDYLRAVTYLCEGYISRTTEKSGGNMNTFEDREEAFKKADKNPDVWLLKHLRNAMTHGVRSSNRDVKPLLQDRQLLDEKLHVLRKTLFQ